MNDRHIDTVYPVRPLSTVLLLTSPVPSTPEDLAGGTTLRPSGSGPFSTSERVDSKYSVSLPLCGRLFPNDHRSKTDPRLRVTRRSRPRLGRESTPSVPSIHDDPPSRPDSRTKRCLRRPLAQVGRSHGRRSEGVVN